MVSEDGHQEASPLYPSPPVEVVRIPGSEAFLSIRMQAVSLGPGSAL